jgi:hypothetical protein
VSHKKGESDAATERTVASKVSESLRMEFEEGLELLFLTRRHGEGSKEVREFVHTHPSSEKSREMARRILKMAFKLSKGGPSKK